MSENSKQQKPNSDSAVKAPRLRGTGDPESHSQDADRHQKREHQKSENNDCNWSRAIMTNIVGTFSNKEDAMNALGELMEAGFDKNSLSLIVSDKAHSAMFASPTDTDEDRVTKGGATGALFGGALGALLASLTAIGTIAIPGAGLLIAGPIVAIISGAGIGAAAGGLSGALIGAGFAEDEASRYEGEINDGKAVVIVHTTGASLRKLPASL